MATFIMMSGVPGSGKTSYAEKFLVEYYDAQLLSSDQFRIDMYGDENDQEHNKEVFRAMGTKAFITLAGGVNVIYDATNINRSTRKKVLEGLPPCEKICYWVDTPVEECIQRDSMRERHVPKQVIYKMNNNYQVPTYDEGWDKIIRIFTEEK